MSPIDSPLPIDNMYVGGSNMYFTLGEIADQLGMSTSTVRRLCDTGVLRAVRPTGRTGHRRVSSAEFARYRASLEGPADAVERTSLDDVLASVRGRR